MDDRMSDKPLGRLLLEGLGEIAWIAVLVALGVLLPLPLVALGWALLLGAEWAMDRWRGKVPYRLQQALFFWVLGGGIALGQALPGFWLGLGGGLLAVIGGVLLQIRFERGLRLERQAPQALDVPLPAGGSAWGGEAPERTPEGEPIRLFDGGEIAMGGPLVCHYLMPDGCFIPDCNPSARFSSDGRHFVSPIPSRGAWGLAIFDRQERLLYRCAVDNFWEPGQRHRARGDRAAQSADVQRTAAPRAAGAQGRQRGRGLRCHRRPLAARKRMAALERGSARATATVPAWRARAGNPPLAAGQPAGPGRFFRAAARQPRRACG